MARWNGWLPLGVAAWLLCSPAAIPQESAGPFPGVWEARFRGSVFAVLKIEDRGRICGVIATGHIVVDGNGDLVQASSGGGEAAIRRARIVDSRLLFEVADAGNRELPVEFSLEVTSDGEALLRFVDLPTRIKPLRFTRRGNPVISATAR